jgi:catalase
MGEGTSSLPLPTDEKIVALSEQLIYELDTIFGEHPGFRPAHAKGTMLSGTFTPSPDAASLSRAPHFNRESTPVTVRFSNSSGIPLMPDNNPKSNPHGIAIRFHLAERVHTDVIGHSADGFPVRTGEEFLEMLRATAATQSSMPSPTPIETFLAAHAGALAFVKKPKPSPSSLGRECYFGVNAMQFTSAAGKSRFGRYRILPDAGIEHLADDVAAAKGENFLYNELAERIAAGPVAFRLKAQLALEEDTVDDATAHWPEDRQMLDLGTITLTAPVADNASEQQHIIFDPIPRVDGIAPSDDPLLELRAAVYLLSGRRRRAAAPTAPTC